MNFEIKSISSKQAENLSEYIFPPVLKLPGFQNFAFFIALQEKELLGMTVISLNPDTPEILSIAVNPKYSNQGIATSLLQGAIEQILELYSAEKMIENNQFLVSFSSELKSNGALSRVFEKLGFKQWETGFFYDISKKELMASENLNMPTIKERVNKKIKNGQIVSLKNTKTQDVKLFLHDLSEKKELIDFIDISSLDEDTSLFSLSDGKITSCILFAKIQNNVLRNILVYQVSKDDLGKAELLYLLSAAAAAISEKYPEDIELSFLATTEHSEALLNKLFTSTSKSGRPLMYVLDFEDAIIKQGEVRFNSDLSLQEVTLTSMVCSSCKYCQDSVLECEKYYQKPDKVLDGENCDYFENK